MPPPTTDPPHTHTVFLVEDDAGTRDAMEALLSAHGYRVRCARRGDEALARLRDEPRPCVIVLDLMMSGMSGDEFRRAQLASATLRDVPVILVSGVRDLAARAQALEAAAYVSKPFEIDRLLAEIRAVLQRATAVA
jgi:DNA-binding response OmpR family regulator